jgi:phenylalanyl-tRNA synthetase alpha chain
MRYPPTHNNALTRLDQRSDPDAVRIKKLLALPDLTRQTNSPVHYVIEAIKAVDLLAGHDDVGIPEIVSVEENFDLLATPSDHPSRSRGDTFYVDDRHVLRTQTTTMWPYYLRDQAVVQRLHEAGQVMALSYGKVYRNDEIDRGHGQLFHQIDGLGVCRNALKQYSIDDLVAILVGIARSIYGPAVEWRVEPDTFPFTDPSIELQINRHGAWTEVLGAGLVNPVVLTRLGIDPAQYNGWAFGFGVDRLAMIKMEIPDIRILWSTDERITRQFTGLDSTYTEVSKCPPTDRDISFLIGTKVALNRIYGLMRSRDREKRHRYPRDRAIAVAEVSSDEGRVFRIAPISESSFTYSRPNPNSCAIARARSRRPLSASSPSMRRSTSVKEVVVIRHSNRHLVRP